MGGVANKGETTMSQAKQKLNITLDHARFRFEKSPTARNAATYRDLALDYWTDEMIGDESLLACLRVIRDTTLEG